MRRFLNWFHARLAAIMAESRDQDSRFQEWLESHERGVELRRRAGIDDRAADR
jgi:hypothetical protein